MQPTLNFIRVTSFSKIGNTDFDRIDECVLIPSHMLEPLVDVIKSMQSRHSSARIVCDNVSLAVIDSNN